MILLSNIEYGNKGESQTFGSVILKGIEYMNCPYRVRCWLREVDPIHDDVFQFHMIICSIASEQM